MISKNFRLFGHFLGKKLHFLPFFNFSQATREKVQQKKVAQNFIAVIFSYHEGLQLEKWLISKIFRFLDILGVKNQVFCHFVIFISKYVLEHSESIPTKKEFSTITFVFTIFSTCDPIFRKNGYVKSQWEKFSKSIFSF